MCLNGYQNRRDLKLDMRGARYPALWAASHDQPGTDRVSRGWRWPKNGDSERKNGDEMNGLGDEMNCPRHRQIQCSQDPAT